MKMLVCLLLFVAAPLFANDAPPATWTPVGIWHAVHTGWTDTLSIKADGTYSRQSNGRGGQWFVFWDGKQISLVLAWGRFAAEPLAMVTSDQFLGSYSYGTFTLTRDSQTQASQSPFDRAAFKKDFLDILYRSLIDEVDQDNFGTAKVVAAEIKKVRDLDPASPTLAPCGIWDWDGGSLAVIYPDGTALNGPTHGQWHWTNPGMRAFEIDWQGGFIDQVTLSADGNLLSIRNNQGKTFEGHRQPDIRPESGIHTLDKDGGGISPLVPEGIPKG